MINNNNPGDSSSNVDMSIASLRQKHRKARSVIASDQSSRNSADLVEQMAKVTEFAASLRVASYIAIRGEIDMQPLMQHFTEKSYYLPLLRGQQMHFAPWKPGVKLQKKEFGLLEPDCSEKDWISPVQLDAVLVPLVVFDQCCNRIGQGGGFYDRTFEFLHNRRGVGQPALIGVAHESQREAVLQSQSWDVPLDFVVTELSVYRRDGCDDT